MKKLMQGVVFAGLLASSYISASPKSKVSATPAASAPSLTFADFELSKPLTISECPTTTYRPGGDLFYMSDLDLSAHGPCWKSSRPGVTLEASGFVPVQLGKMPGGFRLQASGMLVDGSLEGLRVETGGQSAQGFVLEKLVEKYGEPTKLERQPTQNRMGATFESISAAWDFRDLAVKFTGITHKITHGSISIETPAGTTWRTKQDAALRAAEPKL